MIPKLWHRFLAWLNHAFDIDETEDEWMDKQW